MGPEALDDAYANYLARFEARFGERETGAFVKFSKHMVQKLARDAFPERLKRYKIAHSACKQMLENGSTISDAAVMELAEAAAWVAIEAPDIMAMFRGELGNADEGIAARK